MLTEEHTRALMTRAQAGDQAAFGELCRTARPYISAIIRRRADRYPDVVDDLTQETFLHAWRGIGGYRAAGPDPRAWLAGIARNIVIDHYRARAARIQESLIEPVDVPAAGHDPFLAVDDHDQVEQVLAALTRDHRQVLTLYYLAELTSPEIAARTGLADGTVKSRLSYARKAARELAVANV